MQLSSFNANIECFLSSKVSPQEIKHVLKKIDKYVIPLFALIYMLQCRQSFLIRHSFPELADFIVFCLVLTYPPFRYR